MRTELHAFAVQFTLLLLDPIALLVKRQRQLYPEAQSHDFHFCETVTRTGLAVAATLLKKGGNEERLQLQANLNLSSAFNQSHSLNTCNK